MKTKNLVLSLLSVGLLLFTQKAFTQEIKKDSLKLPSLMQVKRDVSVSNQAAFLKDQFKMNRHQTLVNKSTKTDELGMKHEKLQQYYKGVEVYGSTVIIHSKDGKINSISNDFVEIKDLNVAPRISSSIGLKSALRHTKGKKYAWEAKSTEKDFFHKYKKPKGTLVILPDFNGDSKPRLAYRYDIFVLDPLNHVEVFIDAHTGEFIMEYKLMQSEDIDSSGQAIYNGNVDFKAERFGSSYRLRQTTDKIRTFSLGGYTHPIFTKDITSSSPIFSEQTGVQCHWASEQTHKYYEQIHNFNMPLIKSYVHFGRNLINAFNTGNGQLIYGDGDGQNIGPLVTVDIVAHENTHSIVQYSANLIYAKEAGALNESFCDIFGEVIEKFATNTNDWLMGRELFINGKGAFRSMMNPNQYKQPDTYKGTYWKKTSFCIPRQENDQCGVHTNSGVQNKWFYILSIGESGTNDIGNKYSVRGIGIDKAAKIAYRNLTTYLSILSKYDAARSGSIQSAIDLYGADSPEVIATTNAWYAVGVGPEYSSDGGSNTYCESKGKNANYLHIGKVDLGNINNSSDGGNGYSDYTSISTNLLPGNSYTITVTPGRIANYLMGYSAWIDYNQDGDFTDAGEQVWSQANTTASPVSGSFTVPSSALPNSTRLRISANYYSVPRSCQTLSLGEVEDYTVNILDGTGDIEAPTTPTNLTTSNTTQTSTVLSWTASTDNVGGVSGYNVYVNRNRVESTTNTSYNINNLKAGTTYTLEVNAYDAAGNTSSKASASVSTYCESKGSNANYLYIGKVELESINNSSDGGNGYSDHTSISTNLSPGKSYTITVTPGRIANYYIGYSAWIDYNQDGDFTDAGEQVWSQSGTTASPVSGSFTVPSSALPNSTRLRISANYYSVPTSCQTFTLGEVEDYTVNIQNVKPYAGYTREEDANTTLINELNLFPNPTSDFININSQITDIKSVKIYSLDGKLITNLIKSNNRKINVSTFKAGTYIIIVETPNQVLSKKFIKL